MNLCDWCKERGDDTLLRVWDTEANGGLRPADVAAGTQKKVWWRCREHP